MLLSLPKKYPENVRNKKVSNFRSSWILRTGWRLKEQRGVQAHSQIDALPSLQEFGSPPRGRSLHLNIRHSSSSCNSPPPRFRRARRVAVSADLKRRKIKEDEELREETHRMAPLLQKNQSADCQFIGRMGHAKCMLDAQHNNHYATSQS